MLQRYFRYGNWNSGGSGMVNKNRLNLISKGKEILTTQDVNQQGEA